MKFERKIIKFKVRLYKFYRIFFIKIPAFLLSMSMLAGFVRRGIIGKFPEKNILIIRHDAIGDYILFRNFFKVLKDSKKYEGYKVTLVGNEVWKEIAEKLDGEYVDKFIWLDKKAFDSSLSYRYEKLKEITSDRYEVLIHPFSNNFFNADNDMAFLVKAEKKTGAAINPEQARTFKQRLINRLLYLIYDESIFNDFNEMKSVFEFYSNKAFFEKLLCEKIDIEKPSIDLDLDDPFGLVNIASKKGLMDSAGKPALTVLSGDYALFFIGASVKHRKWPIENFVEVGLQLTGKYGYKIVLCGGKGEAEEAAKFAECWKGKTSPINENNGVYLDLVGKISLYELLYVVRGAKIVISNESMLPHIAVAVGGPEIFVISGGGPCYGQFVPYPEEITKKYHVIFHPFIEKNIDEYRRRSKIYGYGYGYDTSLDLAEITAKNLMDRIGSFLKLKN